MKTVYIIFSFIFLMYLSLPSLNFPNSPDKVLQSDEPADTESPDRIAYFGNYERSEIVSHYQSKFKSGLLEFLPFLTLRLNYPPEDAQSIIRDQTRSSYLEEIVHPMRESVYINGFIPTVEKDNIFIGGKEWRQKVTIKFVNSNALTRVAVGILIILLIKIIFESYLDSFQKLISNLHAFRKVK